MDIFEHLRKMKDSDAEPDAKRRRYHSRSYHSFFEGYVEYQTVNEKKKLVTKRVYKGDWYVETISPEKRKQWRLFLGLLGLLRIAAFLWACILPITANSAAYTVAFQFADWALVLFGVFAFINYVPVRERHTIGEYNLGYLRYSRLCLYQSFGFGISALSILICLALNQKEIKGHILCACLHLLAGGIAFLQNRMLNLSDYTVYDNDAAVPEDAMQAEVIRKNTSKEK